MIKGLFCFDGPLYKDKNGNYCSITLTNEMFNRYFYIVDKLIIVVRTYKSNQDYKNLNMEKLELNENIQVIEVENLNSFNGFIFGRLRLSKHIKLILKEVDLIFARMPSTTSDVVISVAQKIGKPYLVEVGGCAWDGFWNHGLIGKIIAPYMYTMMKQEVKQALFATYVTKEFLQNRYPNNNVTAVCSNVYLPQVNDYVLLERLQKIKKIDITRPIIGQAVNSIDVKHKGEHLIIKAIKKLKSYGISAEFQIVGPGSGDFLKKQAKKYGVLKQINFIGTLKKAEILQWYKTIDLYTQPSKQEGLPRSLIEAMSVGCPAIGSNIAGIPELLENKYLFNPDDENQIVNVLLAILNKEIMLEQAKINYIKAKDYNINIIEKQRKKIFKQYYDYFIKLKK